MDLFIVVVVCVFVSGDVFVVFRYVVLWEDLFVLVLCGVVLV